MTCKELLLPMEFKGENILVHVLIYGPKNSRIQALCLHGFASSGKVGFENVAKEMKGYNLVAIDWIGYGQSSKPLRNVDTYDIEYMKSFLLKFIDIAIQKKILRKKFNIIAASMSGIALGACYNDLEKYIEKMVLINPAGFDRRINMKFSLLLVNPLIRMDKFRKLISTRVLKGELFGWKEDQKKRLAELLYSDEFKVYLRLVKAAVRPRGKVRNVCRCMDPSKIKVPVLLIASQKDTLFGAQNYIKVAQKYNWKILRIEYYEHAVLIYRPKDIAQAIKEFIPLDS